MHSRCPRSLVLVGSLVVLALVCWGGERRAMAETLDLSAILSEDCAAGDVEQGADLSLVAELDAQGGGTAPPAATAPADPAAAGKACKTNRECALPKEYCAKKTGDCKGEGRCTVKPKLCSEQGAPAVCGCNKKTYPGACYAAKNGVNVEHEGACQKK
ncbi:MAG TPA: hypothetical protein VHQ90_11475 [Thermoanaerobaculia bacterium]|nr:hypothetical protein [Thermoanaerobaculia bacterium]